MSVASSFEFRNCRCRKVIKNRGKKNLQLKYLSLGQEGLGGWVLGSKAVSHGALTPFTRDLASDGDSILYSC